MQKNNFLFIFLFSFSTILCDSLDSFAHALKALGMGPEPSSKSSESNLKSLYFEMRDFFDTIYKNGTYQKDYKTITAFTGDLLSKTATLFIAKMEQTLQGAQWLKGGTPEYLFVRKVVLPVDSIIEIRGDLHGDVRSLIHWLEELRNQGWFDAENPFKMVKKGHYLAFLGDYTDRGHYGAEVMFIIMQLFLHNPENVLIVRGNHEDFRIITRYGF